LKTAARQARGAFAYRQVDALVNLAWLQFYAEEPETAIEVLDEAQAEEIVPAGYWFTEEEGQPTIKDPIAFMWVQMGKAHLLRGQIALQEYQGLDQQPGQVKDPALWARITEHFALALAYNEQFADDFRDMRRAKDTMYDLLRGINTAEVKEMYDAAERVADKYRLREFPDSMRPPVRPRMRNFLREYFGLPEGYGALEA
jgi:hypothetical protein